MALRGPLLRSWIVVHGWTGLVFGLILFMLAVSGSLASLGDRSLLVWSEPVLSQAPEHEPEAIEAMVASDLAQDDYGYEHAEIRFPGDGQDRFIAVLVDDPVAEGLPQAREFLHDPVTLDVVAVRDGMPGAARGEPTGGVVRFITSLHLWLLLPEAIGVPLASLAALGFVLLVVGGILIHTKLLKEAFVLRKINPLVMVRDLHKLVGTWSLPFLLISSVTASILSIGLHYILPLSVLVNFGGDMRTALAQIQPTPVVSEAQDVRQLGLAEAIERSGLSRDQVFGGRIKLNELDNDGAYIRIEPRAEAVAVGCPQSFEFGASDGRLVRGGCAIGSGSEPSLAVIGASFALHKGQWAGVVSNFLWAIFGLGLATLAWSGVHMWFLRSAMQAREPDRAAFYRRLQAVADSVLGGFAAAVALLLTATPLIWTLSPFAAQGVIYPAFVAAWAIIGLVAGYAGLGAAAWMRTLAALAVLAVVSHSIGLAVFGFGPSAEMIAVDVFLLVFAGSLFAASKRLSPARREPRVSTKSAQAIAGA